MVKTVTVDGLLFDMDGTLIDSTPGVFKAWATFSTDYNLGDHRKITHATHGRRLYDTLAEYCSITNEAMLLAEIDRFEDEVIQGGPLSLPGAITLLAQYAPRAIERCGLPIPAVGIITSNDVPRGKPYPDPYLAGAQRCTIEPTNCLVVEDAISGLKSGKAAGARTLAVCTSTSRDMILRSEANPDFIVADLTCISVSFVNGELEVSIDESKQ
ncbi:hypothetical protein AMATHDRAFT_72473 [Amanita thiersii Skay4041]|uniref:Uncharacterized protein n=1 Tax=Amanita thiersii Skay4041 TaxID=703135 RepID=A0A2A9P1Q7_9AGAR|nr:hypothetical protein AMATHDRAFT_72473 [Amanita thiersii Skay4041]